MKTPEKEIIEKLIERRAKLIEGSFYILKDQLRELSEEEKAALLSYGEEVRLMKTGRSIWETDQRELGLDDVRSCLEQDYNLLDLEEEIEYIDDYIDEYNECQETGVDNKIGGNSFFAICQPFSEVEEEHLDWLKAVRRDLLGHRQDGYKNVIWDIDSSSMYPFNHEDGKFVEFANEDGDVLAEIVEGWKIDVAG